MAMAKGKRNSEAFPRVKHDRGYVEFLVAQEADHCRKYLYFHGFLAEQANAAIKRRIKTAMTKARQPNAR
jgi:hypothetical protein